MVEAKRWSWWQTAGGNLLIGLLCVSSAEHSLSSHFPPRGHICKLCFYCNFPRRSFHSERVWPRALFKYTIQLGHFVHILQRGVTNCTERPGLPSRVSLLWFMWTKPSFAKSIYSALSLPPLFSFFSCHFFFFCKSLPWSTVVLGRPIWCCINTDISDVNLVEIWRVS